jgi:hypothetical protein
VKYPIEDALIEKMPMLHGAHLIPNRPVPKLMSLPNFDQLLSIWQFLNDFQEFFGFEPFKIEMLHAALV